MNNVTKESSSCISYDRNKSSWLYTCFTKNFSDPEELWEEKVMEDIDLNLLI